MAPQTGCLHGMWIGMRCWQAGWPARIPSGTMATNQACTNTCRQAVEMCHTRSAHLSWGPQTAAPRRCCPVAAGAAGRPPRRPAPGPGWPGCIRAREHAAVKPWCSGGVACLCSCCIAPSQVGATRTWPLGACPSPAGTRRRSTKAAARWTGLPAAPRRPAAVRAAAVAAAAMCCCATPVRTPR